MKILFHIYGLGAGGAERQLTYLVKGLHEKGLEPHVLVLSEGGPFWEELKAWGKCPLISLNWRGKMDFSVIFKMAHYVKENQIDLIQGWLSPTNSYAAIAAMLTKRIAVMGIRNSKEEEEYGFGPWLYVRIDKIFAYFPVVKKVICNSYQGQKYHLDLGYPQRKLCVIPNGIPFPVGINWPIPLAHKPPWHIGIIACLRPMKDYVSLLEAIAKLVKKGKSVVLHIYGDGSNAYRRILEQRIDDLDIHSQVYWHGHTNQIWEAFKNIDILVSSSAYGEGISNSLLEGMVAGRIIVSTDVGDAKYMLNGKTKCGYIVPPKNANALAQTIEAIITQPQSALELAENAQQVVKQNYHINTMIKAYINLYQKFISTKVNK